MATKKKVAKSAKKGKTSPKKPLSPQKIAVRISPGKAGSGAGSAPGV